MDIRWRGAAIVAALLVGAPAYGQAAGSQMGTAGQRSPGDAAAGSTTSNQGTGTTGSEPGATESRGSTSSTMGTGSAAAAAQGKELSEDLAKAVQELHAANQFEVKLAEHAAQAAQSPQVKHYAEMIQKDHQKSDEKLQELASSMGATLTGEQFQEKEKDGQKKIDELKEKQGRDFDKAYMSLMVEDHKKDVKEVEKAAKEARKEKHTQLASFLQTTHTKLQGHLQQAQRVEKQLERSGSQARSGSRAGELGTGSGAAGAGGGTGSEGAAGSHSGAVGPGGGTGGKRVGGK